MKRFRGWATVAGVSIVANLGFFATAKRFPNGPVGRLWGLVAAKPTSGSGY